jgi:protein-tyrosine phosphatase
VFRQRVNQAGLSGCILADSAGTAAYHIGEPPDPRACRVASQRGYDLTGLRARQLDPGDFARFDYIVVMDIDNLRKIARVCPPEYGHKVKLFTEFCSKGACTIEDPYLGGTDDFLYMLDRIEDGVDGLLKHVTREIGN